MYGEQDEIKMLDLGHRGVTSRKKLNLSKENIDTVCKWTGNSNQLVHKRTLNHWVYIINSLLYCISFKEIVNSRKKSNLVNAKLRYDC